MRTLLEANIGDCLPNTGPSLRDDCINFLVNEDTSQKTSLLIKSLSDSIVLITPVLEFFMMAQRDFCAADHIQQQVEAWIVVI
jgi:hypothetical protein